MSEPIISYRAEKDLDSIWLHYAKSSVAAADRFLEDFRERAAIHVQLPGMGILRDDVLARSRCFIVGRYLAFYRIEGESIRILRVLHGSRDIPAAFQEPD